MPEALIPLARSIAGIEVAALGPLPAFDLHCPMLSLPLAMGTRIDTVPDKVPYLAASADKIAEWEARLGPRARRRIGLAWSGNPGHRNDRNRSIALEKLLPLLQADAEFHSLQSEYREADALLFVEDGRMDEHGAELVDFADTAALIGQMDLVITVDTAVAHMAGALGKPVYVMLPRVPDYRWGLSGETSPWYPTARLFRQTTAGDWSGVIAALAEAIG